jgi:hypothetical protein
VSSDNAVGILGVGTNTAGPNATSPTTALPGNLGNGLLIDEPAKELVFGSNPYSPVATLNDGTTTSELTYTVSNANGSVTTPTPGPSTIVDSGGVYGTILQSALPGNTSSIPDGTTIYVDANGIPVYHYTVDSTNAPTVISSGSQNTGSIPFSQVPIYLDYTNQYLSFD